MRVITQHLQGAALDWAVGAAFNQQYDEPRTLKVRKHAGTSHTWVERANEAGSIPHFHRFTPSTSWDQGGPIIAREGIGLTSKARDHSLWGASLEYAKEVVFWDPMRTVFTYGLSQGKTPLEAAMRCYVTSVLGNQVSIPEDLL